MELRNISIKYNQLEKINTSENIERNITAFPLGEKRIIHL